MKNPRISEDSSFYRKIYYEIDRVGENVEIFSKNKKYKNIKLDQITGKKIFILVKLKYLRMLPGLIYFDELGKRIETEALEKKEKAYVLLGMVEKTNDDEKSQMRIDDTDLSLANKLWVNQIKSDGSFHFDTTGKIFGLGFGPKYSIDESTNLSIGQFANKKRLFPKMIYTGRHF